MKDIITTLQQRYPQGEYRILKEVQHLNRSADFIIVSLWPSRGLSIIGIERKSHRTDWLKEMKTPAKADVIFNHCDYWYLLTDNDNVAKLEEIPDAWGWLHIKDGRVSELKKAPKIEKQSTDVNRSFAVSVIRRATDGMIHESAIKDKVESAKLEAKEAALKEYERRNQSSESELKEVREAIRSFESSSGIQIHRWDAGRIGEAVKFVLSGGIDRQKSDLEHLKEKATRIVDAINSVNKQAQC